LLNGAAIATAKSSATGGEGFWTKRGTPQKEGGDSPKRRNKALFPVEELGLTAMRKKGRGETAEEKVTKTFI